MKRFVLPVIAVAVLGLSPAVSAQVVGGEGDVDMGDGRTGRTPRTERIPGTGRTPRTERIPGTGRTERIPGTPRTERIPGTPRVGDDDVRRLPKTGSPVAAIAMDGVTMLGAGLVLLRARRRLQTA